MSSSGTLERGWTGSSGLDGQLAVFLEQLGGLEGQDFIRMIDTILGPPPAGSGPILTMTAHQP